MISDSLVLILILTSGCLCYLALGICAFMSKKVSIKIILLEPGLRVYLKIMLTLSFVRPISSMVLSIYCLIGNDVNSPHAYYMRIVTTFSGNIIIISALGISIDCVVASITSQQTPLLRKKIHGYLAAVASVIYALSVSIIYFMLFCGCGPVFYLFATYEVKTSTVGAIGLIYFFYNVGILFVILFFMVTCFKKARMKQLVTDVKYNNDRISMDHFEQLKVMWK
uniref:G_PROTEIN_RECEP_F1_2 domain-containing protein n=1 Tax=Panagrellus redivivus TaxID=6233 RepID=A0A7E4ZSF8_PANRE